MLRQVLATLLTASVGLSLHAQDAAPGTSGETQPQKFTYSPIPLIADRSGCFLLCKSSISGTPLHFLVDTGAHLEFALGREWAEKQKLTLEEGAGTLGIGGKDKSYTTRVKDLNIAGVVSAASAKVNVVSFKLGLEFGGGDQDGAKVDGLLGSTFFEKTHAVIDFADKRLLVPSAGVPAEGFVTAAKSRGEVIEPLFKGFAGAPYVELKVGGKPWLFLVDTAAGTNVLLPEVAKELNLKTEETANRISGGGGSTGSVRRTVLKDIHFTGGAQIAELTMSVLPCPSPASLPKDKPFAGIIGNGVLTSLKAKLDLGSYHLILPTAQQLAKAKEDEPKKAPEGAAVLKGSTPDEIMENAVTQFFNVEPLVKSKEGQFYKQVEINGKSRWMCFDTGADGVMMNNTLAKEDKIDLKKIGDSKGPDGAPVATSEGVLARFQVGKLNYDGATVMFTDLGNFAEFTMPDGSKQTCVGQLGTGFIGGAPVVMDLSHSRYLVRKQKIQGGYAGIQANFGFATAPLVENAKARHYVEAEVMGQKGLFLIDSGALSCMLYDNVAKSLKLETRELEGTTNTLGRKGLVRRATQVKDLKIGGHTLNGNVGMVVLPISQTETFKDLPIFGILGCSFYGSRNSIVDFDNNVMTLNKEILKKDS